MFWSNFYYEGGFGMYPTTIFGFFLVAAAVIYLLRAERRFANLVLSLGILTMVAGVLGTSIGVINTFHYLQKVPQAKQFMLAALGCAESLNNLVLALLFAGLSMVLVSIGALRSARQA